MKQHFIGIAFAIGVGCSPAIADSPSLPDAAFVRKASVGDIFEQEEAKLALTCATDPRLKDFA